MKPTPGRLLIAAAFALAAQGASAAPADMWSGWYGGATFGYGFGENHIDIAPVSPGAFTRFGFVSPQLNDNPAGPLGGLLLGVNRQSGSFVYGVETDLSAAAIRDRVVGPFLQAPFNFQTTDSQALDWFGTLRARAGFTPFERTLVFVTGGLAYGRASVSTFAIDTSANICGGTIKFCIGGHAQRWMAGFALGGGFEQAFAHNWTARLDYLYYDLGTLTNTMTDILTPDPDVFHGATHVRGNLVRGGISYRFAGD